jgi:hypothetical protein
MVTLGKQKLLQMVLYANMSTTGMEHMMTAMEIRGAQMDT